MIGPLINCIFQYIIFCSLQKEVKARIQYILDVLGKMETALQQPIFEEEPPSRIRSPSPKETRRVKRASSEDHESDNSRFVYEFYKNYEI